MLPNHRARPGTTGGTQRAPTASDRIPVDQLLGSDDNTSGSDWEASYVFLLEGECGAGRYKLIGYAIRVDKL